MTQRVDVNHYAAGWSEDQHPPGSRPEPAPSLRYLDQFFRLRCAADLHALNLFPNAKEVTESFAAFCALRRWPGVTEFGKRWHCIVVADGHTPRTGALIACLTRWRVTSIDPEMKVTPRWEKVQRLRTIRANVQDVPACELPAGEDGTAVVAVHGHAPNWSMRALWSRLPEPRVYIALPCCRDQRLEREPTAEYADWNVHSPKRDVLVYA